MDATPSPGDVTRHLRELVQGGRFVEALAVYRRSDEGTGSRPDAQLLAATAATRLGELAVAEGLATAALARFRARGDGDGRLRSLNLLGVIRFERGRLPEAETALAEALSLANLTGDTLLAARANNNLASALHLRGRHEEALALYRGALLAYQRLGDRRGAAEAYHNLGLIFRQLGDWRNADDATNEALRHADLVGERGLQALATTGRAELMVERDHLMQARLELERAARLAAEAGDEIGVAEVERVRALAAVHETDYAGAAAHAERALASARQLGVALLASECAAIAAVSLHAIGRVADAARRRAEAVAGFEALGAVDLLQKFSRDWDAAREPGG